MLPEPGNSELEGLPRRADREVLLSDPVFQERVLETIGQVTPMLYGPLGLPGLPHPPSLRAEGHPLRRRGGCSRGGDVPRQDENGYLTSSTGAPQPRTRLSSEYPVPTSGVFGS
ncbi:hypothetical protein [Streptomyces capitiformicae]|uniref:Uncharacterized protein n=1 Tax=Streptomyces capitiformicae TaxID=2014920 RepID=A0A918ZB64_9ACTN|nr:hypothetical protein [Streptomyces capitiformicae]GHE41634.1 hypothetical protein GCM10017771_60960 [Streptomyces capitiformicae]